MTRMNPYLIKSKLMNPPNIYRIKCVAFDAQFNRPRKGYKVIKEDFPVKKHVLE